MTVDAGRFIVHAVEVRRLRYTLALLVFVGCEEEDPAPELSDEVYCDIVGSMDEDLCPGWRDDYDTAFVEGCYEAALSAFEEDVGGTYDVLRGLEPDQDTCLE